MIFRDQTFDRETINLDDNTFTGCTFNECKIIYKGSDFVYHAANHFNRCTWFFEGPAGHTIELLRVLYHAGASDLVDDWIDYIKAEKK